MLILCFHFSRNTKDGEYQRIRKLHNDIILLSRANYREFQIIRFTDFLKDGAYHLKTPSLVANGKKTVLPILFPGVRYRAIRSVNQWIGKIIGGLIGFIYKPDYCIGETHGSFPFCYGLKATSLRTKIVIDLHGACPEEALYSHAFQKNIQKIASQMNKIEIELIDLADKLICQSEAMFLHLESKHDKSIKDKYIYQCGVNTDKFNSSYLFRNEKRKELNISNKDIVFVYLGGLNQWQLIDSVFEIFNELSKNNDLLPSKLLILSNESEDVVLRKAEAHGIEITKLRIKSVDHGDVPKYLSACDYGFLLREDTTLNRVACPTKLGEYLACGVPVITTTIANIWSWTNEDADTFCIVDPKHPISAASIIAKYISMNQPNIQVIKNKCRNMAVKKLSMFKDLNNIRTIFEGKQE